MNRSVFYSLPLKECKCILSIVYNKQNALNMKRFLDLRNIIGYHSVSSSQTESFRRNIQGQNVTSVVLFVQHQRKTKFCPVLERKYKYLDNIMNHEKHVNVTC